jgi:uncharacterized protein
MRQRIIHFENMGSDPGKSQNFYADLFAWKLGDPAPDLGNYAMVDIQAAGLSGGIASERPGGKVTSPPMTIPGTAISPAQFIDPDGNLIGLVKGM